MVIESQFSDCGCALMRDEKGELKVQPGLGCVKFHDWALIIAGIENEALPLFAECCEQCSWLDEQEKRQ